MSSDVQLRRHQTQAVRQPTVTQRLSEILRRRRLRIGSRSASAAGHTASSLSDSLTLSETNTHSAAHRNVSNTRSGSSLFRNGSTKSFQSGKSGLSFRSTKSGQSTMTTLTTLSSVSGSSSSSGHKRKRGKLLRTSKYEEEISDGHLGINEKELNSMNKHIPALKGFNPKSATFRQHYYPEGGWGWIIAACAVLVQILTSGIQMSFGILYIHILRSFDKDAVMTTAWVGVICLSISFGITPFLVAFCRRKSTRLTAVVGGLVMALSILFASFANELHQVVISYGFMFGIGCCMVRETCGLMVSQYFKRKRQNVEILSCLGTGLGLSIFSYLFNKLITSHAQTYEKEWPDGSHGWRRGLQSIAVMLTSLFFLGMFYRSASLYHPQRRAILHIKDMSKKKGKDKNKIENKPPYFDFSTLKMKSLQGMLIFTLEQSCISSSITDTAFAAPTTYEECLANNTRRHGAEPFYARDIGRESPENKCLDTVVLLQTFLGLGIVAGTLGFSFLLVNKSKQCLISPQYLLQISILGIGISILALTSVQEYQGHLLFVWMYGTFLGGFHYVLKMFTFQKIRAKHFPRGWSFVQGSRFVPLLVGVPLTGYINIRSGNTKAGYYLSFVFVILGAVTLFFMEFWKHRHHHKHDRYCEIRGQAGHRRGQEASTSEAVVEPENLSQKLSEVHHSEAEAGSVILSEHESIRDAESLNRSLKTSNNNRVNFTIVVPMDPEQDDDDDEHSYHFRGKPELLAGISEENLLEQLEIEYLGDITSCNKVENYLMCSEYERQHMLGNISEGDSFSSSQAHSEQITAPINNKKGNKMTAGVNHSFSEPDLLRLFSKYRASSIKSPKHKVNQQHSLSNWRKTRQQKQKPVSEMPVIHEAAPSSN